MVHRITSAIIAIAICLFLVYGVGTAASRCCSVLISICSPSGVESPLMSTNDAQCQPSPSRYLYRHKAVGESTGSVWFNSNETTTCCPAIPCTPIGFDAHPGQLAPSSPWLQESGRFITSARNHNPIAFSQICNTFYHPTPPIFLLTKSIIC